MTLDRAKNLVSASFFSLSVREDSPHIATTEASATYERRPVFGLFLMVCVE